MAVTQVVPATSSVRGPATCSGPTELVASGTTLTTSYVPAAGDGNALITMGWDTVVFSGPYVKGSEGAVRFQPEGSNDGGTTWVPLPYKENPTGGYSDLFHDRMTIDPANYDANDYWATPPMDCRGWPLVRCRAKYESGSSPGTWGCNAVVSRSWV